MNNFQRKDAKSNAHVGYAFEVMAKEYLDKTLVLDFQSDHDVALGVGKVKKIHRFDFGVSGKSNYLVECKAHTWTSGKNVPSAKLTVWNEAMYYFYIAPKKFVKILFVQMDKRTGSDERTLAEYYVDYYSHLIPNDVEIWEFDLERKTHRVISTDRHNVEV